MNNKKKLIFRALGISIFLLFAPMSVLASCPLPQGSYLSTCLTCSNNCKTIFCSCYESDGVTLEGSTISSDKCKTLKNNNGQLTCE